MSNHLNIYQISRLLFIGEIRPSCVSVSIIDIRRGAPLGLGGGGGRVFMRFHALAVIKLRVWCCLPDAICIGRLNRMYIVFYKFT